MSNLSDLKPGSWTVDASHSEVGFTARHLMVSKVRGQFKDFAAVVTVAQPFEQSTVEATVQLASIDTNSPDRDTHLKSADFFDVENNPAMTFKSTKVTDDALEGLLTIKGVTKPVTFDLDFGGVSADPWGGTRAGFEATTEINRKDFDLSWNVAIEGGGVLVGEKVKIALDVQLVLAPVVEPVPA
jgi:polyisoprenoid-binding protein YceI